MGSVIFDNFWTDMATGGLDLAEDEIRLMLLGASYAPSVEHSRVDDVVEHEITGPGYREGGAEILVEVDKTDGAIEYSFHGALWAPSEIRARFGLYYKKMANAPPSAEPLLLVVDFGKTVISENGGVFMVDPTLVKLMNDRPYECKSRGPNHCCDGNAACSERTRAPMRTLDQVLTELARVRARHVEVISDYAEQLEQRAAATRAALVEELRSQGRWAPRSTPALEALDESLEALAEQELEEFFKLEARH